MKPWLAIQDEGRAAFLAGKGFLDNPYLDKDEDNVRHWVDGFVQAMRDSNHVVGRAFKECASK